jgi:hypothetical protein
MGSFCRSHFNASTARAITASSFAAASAEALRVGDLQETTSEFMKAVGDDLSHFCDKIDNPRPQLNASLCGMLIGPGTTNFAKPSIVRKRS